MKKLCHDLTFCTFIFITNFRSWETTFLRTVRTMQHYRRSSHLPLSWLSVLQHQQLKG